MLSAFGGKLRLVLIRLTAPAEKMQCYVYSKPGYDNIIDIAAVPA
jgi:hypothetical protein